MSSSPSPAGVPIAADLAADATEADEGQETGTPVGDSDLAADAARAGEDVDMRDATRDSDGVPVGQADTEADAERARADRDQA